MATVKFPSEMSPATSIGGNDKLMISKEATGEAYQATFNQAKEYLNITGIELEPLVGGDTSGSALVVSPGPIGEQRTAEVASGKYYNFGSGAVLATADRRWKAYWNGSSWSLKDMGALPTTDLTGYISEPDLGKVSIGKNEFNPSLIQDGKKIVSGGGIVSEAGCKSVIGQHVVGGQLYTISGIPVDALKYLVFRNASGAVLASQQFNAIPKVVIATAGAVTVDYTIKLSTDASDSVFSTLMFEKGNTASAYEPYKEAITSINNSPIETSRLAKENVTPDPLTDKNAVNLSHFNKNALKNSDIEIEFTSNLARQILGETVIPDKYIMDNGGINQSGTGWKMYAFYPLKNGLVAGDQFVVGRFTISGGGYAAWYNGATLLANEGAIVTPHVYTVPLGATENTVLYIDISRPTGANYASLTINKGAVLQPYEEPKAYITKIKTFSIEGSGVTPVSSFADLIDVPAYAGNANKALKINDTENGLAVFEPVEQNTDVAFDTVTANAVVVENVPVWDETGTSPVTIGQEYLKADGTGHYFRKVRGV